MGRRKKDSGGGDARGPPKAAVAADDAADDDAMWQRMHELLTGLLGVELDTRFQHESKHPNASWLVVHVTQVQDTEPQRGHQLPKRIGEVLAAVASLCMAAERLRLHEQRHLAFWTRVFASQMMARPLSSGDATIWWFSKHTRERELRVKLRWADRKLEKAMLVPLGTFLDAEPSNCGPFKPRPMGIALCVTKVNLTAKDIELLGQVLTPPDGSTSHRARLFKDVIASLEISDAVLRVDALRALAQKVYPMSRRIDELRLEAVFPSGPLADPKTTLDKAFVSAFKSLLAAALSVENGSSSKSSHPVGLSLAYNPLDAVHLRAVYAALKTATRELSALSLKYALLPPRSTRGNPSMQVPNELIMALGHIIFQTTSLNGRGDVSCELDLTGRPLQEREVSMLVRARHVAVEESALAIRNAHAAGQSVVCHAGNFMDAEVDDHMMQADDDFVVLEVLETDYLRVGWLRQEDLPAREGFVPLSSVNEIRVNGRVLVGSRFDRWILDGDVESRLEGVVCGCENRSILSQVASRATVLSMRGFQYPHHRHSMSEMVSCCHGLTHLSVEGSPTLFTHDTRLDLLQDQLSRLESLHVGSTQIYNDHLHRFVDRLLEAPQRRLKRLSLAQNNLNTASLALIRRLLDATPTLELVEIDSFGASDMESYIEARRALARDHEGVLVSTTPINAPDKLAFISVVEEFCYQTALEPSVYTRIFEFSEVATHRHILWHQSR